MIVKKKRFATRKKSMATNITDLVGVRIMGLFLAVLSFGIVVFEIFYIQSLYSYYYDNVSGSLTTQARYNAELFLSYVSDYDLNTVVLENKNQFYRANTMQVQLLNNNGTVLFDSLGTRMTGQELKSGDVTEAQENRIGRIMGQAPYTDERVMSLSYPLNNNQNQVGILRLTTSLKDVDQLINGRILVSLIFSVIVLVMSGILSFLMSRSIVSSIKNLTSTALKLADGQYKVRADESSRGEIGELARTMNRMSDNIIEKETLKNEFISSVSHELRTPLTSIKGWAITLQSDGIKPELIDEGLKIIEKESERLGSMVEELLDFSRFSSGRMKFNKISFNLSDMAKHILMQMQPRIREKELNMIYHFDAPEIIVIADNDRIKQVLLNLLDNAIKFTVQGGTIYLDIKRDEEKGEVRMTVTDTGIGISEDEIGLVTEKFWKGSSSQSHSGLGLSISEEIAKAHDGSLTIKSKLGAGTSVTLTLPLPEERREG